MIFLKDLKVGDYVSVKFNDTEDIPYNGIYIIRVIQPITYCMQLYKVDNISESILIDSDEGQFDFIEVVNHLKIFL